MERISVYQLFTITVFFQLGSSVIFGFASSAGRDAWLAILISTALGIMLILMYIALMKMNPSLTVVEWFPAQLGKWIGMPIAWLYPLLFLYVAGRILADVKSIIPVTILPQTPSWFIVLSLLLVVLYGVSSGIEVIARLTEYLLPMVLIIFMIEVILLFFSDVVNINYILPVVGQGWGKIWTAVWPTGITQTFAETLTLAMIWPLVKETEKVMKVTIIAAIVSGITIAILSLMQSLVFAESILERTLFPVYTLMQQISIADFLDNLDAIVSLVMVLTAFAKLTLYFFAAVRSMQLLLNLSSSRYLILPVAIITYMLGMTMSTNLSEHIYVGIHIFPLHLWVPLLIVLPFLLLVVTVIRRIFTKVSSK
ncbi:GerAB/ArcD/ProY family transporter [Oceanobacillus profundus]|uniref:GerAB/ArcD/ProY family transporter n=1 Tax=Oceanobacillus profundus TaxID=372463 RepID=UPI00363165CF